MSGYTPWAQIERKSRKNFEIVGWQVWDTSPIFNQADAESPDDYPRVGTALRAVHSNPHDARVFREHVLPTHPNAKVFIVLRGDHADEYEPVEEWSDECPCCVEDDLWVTDEADDERLLKRLAAMFKDGAPPDLLDRIGHRTTLGTDSADRKEAPLFEGVLKYFPAALAAVARLSKAGNDKHNPGEPLHHARGKSTDEADCILRHLVDLSEDFGHGVGRDENGVPQVAMIAWRALALAQRWIEANDGAPLAPNAWEDE